MTHDEQFHPIKHQQSCWKNQTVGFFKRSVFSGTDICATQTFSQCLSSRIVLWTQMFPLLLLAEISRVPILPSQSLMGCYWTQVCQWNIQYLIHVVEGYIFFQTLSFHLLLVNDLVFRLFLILALYVKENLFFVTIMKVPIKYPWKNGMMCRFLC